MTKKSPITRTWHLFVPERGFEEFALEVTPVRLSNAAKFCWYAAQLPESAPAQYRHIVAEGGTGYILGRGPTPEDARQNARENAANRANLSCYIQGQVQILTRFFNLSNIGMVVPKPETA